jgi:hypothetical protein
MGLKVEDILKIKIAMKILNKYAIFFFLSCFCVYQPAWADKHLTWNDCLLLAYQNHPDLISANKAYNPNEALRFE